MDRDKITELASRRNTYIYTILWSFVSGVLVASFIHISPIFSVFLIALSGAIFFIEKLWRSRIVLAEWDKIPYESVLVMCALLCFSLGSLRYAIKDFHIAVMPSGEGIVASEPEHRDADTRFVYRADNGERALVSTDLYSPVEYGDRVSVSAKFKRPDAIAEENGRTFDYPAYLSKDDIYWTASFARVEQASGQRLVANVPAPDREQQVSVRLMRTILEVKSAFVSEMKRILPEPESSLLAGLIVAGKDALPKSVLADFQNAGVIHIVVLSGYNITVVAEFFLILLGAFSLSLRKRAVFAAIGILIFVLMAGASASIIRAALMALVVLLGKVVRRQASSSRLLLMTAALMLLWNPKLLVFDPSFQLTFLAMLALVYVEPLVTPRLRFISERYGLRQLLGTTIATQVTVLPYLLYSVGSVSVVSLVSNVLILPLVPFTMLIGFLATLVAFVSSYIAWPLSFISHLLLVWILGVAHMLGSLRWASIKMSLSIRSALILYAMLGGIVWAYRSKKFLDKTKATNRSSLY